MNSKKGTFNRYEKQNTLRYHTNEYLVIIICDTFNILWCSDIKNVSCFDSRCFLIYSFIRLVRDFFFHHFRPKKKNCFPTCLLSTFSLCLCHALSVCLIVWHNQIMITIIMMADFNSLVSFIFDNSAFFRGNFFFKMSHSYGEISNWKQWPIEKTIQQEYA